MDLKNEILTEIDDISNRRRGKLSIGISHTRGKFFLPEVLPTFMEQHPNIEISLTENNSSRLEDALAKGNIDLLIEFSPILLEQVDTVQIFSERLFVVVPKKYITRLFPNSYAEAVHRFKNGFEIEPFAKMPFLLTPIQNRVRNLFQHYVKRHGVSLNVLLESENSETLLSLACKGVGITTYPEMFVNHLSPLITADSSSPVEFFPIEEKDTTANLVIAYNKEKYLSDAAKDFIRSSLQVHYGV